MTYQFKSDHFQHEADNGYVELALFEGDNEIAIIRDGEDAFWLHVKNYGEETEVDLVVERFDDIKDAVGEMSIFLKSEYAGA